MFIIRLDDAAQNMNIKNWKKMEFLLDKHNIKPIVGVIPNLKDSNLLSQYTKIDDFWDIVKIWNDKEWNIAMHGYDHVYITKSRGINPVNSRSEFAGVDLDVQRQKFILASEIFKKNGISPNVFFAPSHTFDLNTLLAIKETTKISIISDTIANKPYIYSGLRFIPQQYSFVRKSCFRFTTFCYHPNTMKDNDFEVLDNFLSKYKINHVNNLETLKFFKRNIYDLILNFAYFCYRRLRSLVKKSEKD